MSDYDFASKVISIPDYPEPGVIFKDITPLFSDAETFAALVDDFANHFADKGITKVIGAEARGFLIGPPVAYKLGAGFIPARKPGKLPREVYSESYALVDDLIATGGTAVAMGRLAQRGGAEVVGFSFIMELAFLNPRGIMAKDFGDREIYTIIKVE